MTCRRLILLLALCLSLVSSATAEVVRLEVPGGWYGEGRLDRQYAVLVTNQFVQTRVGRVELPRYVADGREVADNVLFLRVTPSGPFRMAGQSHAGLGNWEWADGFWRIVGPSYGVNPVIYDWAGVLHLGALPFGSQGFRYATHTNALVTGDATYADPARAIWEYTTYGDVTIGQGEAGCIAIRDQDRRMLERGDCRFVRYTRTADLLALTLVKQIEGKTVLLWLSVSDLASFPPETPFITPPPPEICGNGLDDDGDGLVDENCEPEPQPIVCGQVPAVGQAALRQLAARPDVDRLVRSPDEAERRISAQMFGEQMAFTVDPKWGNKNAGGGRPRSKDSIALLVGKTICNWDIVDGTTRELSFHDGFVLPTVQEFMPVTPKNHLGSTIPDPNPDPALAARVLALEQALVTTQGLVTGVQARLEEAQARLTRLEQQPGGVQEDRVRALIEDYFARAVVSGSTASGFFVPHTHRVELGVTIR